MASLANQTISSTYDGLIKTSTDQPVGVSGVQLLEDGVGNTLALSVGRANQGVTVTGTLTATAFSGDLTGDVTGNLTGDVTGDVTGNLTGNVTGDVTGDLTGTVLTAAQTNITSVGTLSSLNVTGNVGIGVSPSVEMHLKKDSNVRLRLETSNTGTSTLQFADSDDGNVGIIQYDHNVDAMIFDVNATERIRIDSSGNVGIGVVPYNKLSVVDSNQVLGSEGILSLKANAAAQNNGGQITFGTTSARHAAIGGRQEDIGGSAGYLQFGTRASSGDITERMRIDSSGNVEINGSAAPLFSVKSTASGTPTAFVYASTNGADFGSLTNHPTKFYVNNSEKMRIDSAGKVAIGGNIAYDNLSLELSSATAYSNGVDSQGLTLYNSSATTGQFVGITFSGTPTAGNSGVATILGTTTGNGNMDLTFSTRNNAVLTEKMRILSSGGITFNGDTAAANALDDYEEGTWTPAIAFGGNSVGVTYDATNRGKYTKIGNQVTVTGLLLLTNKGTSTGTASLTGLPFTVNSNSGNYASASLRGGNITFTGRFQGVAITNSTRIQLDEMSEGGTLSALTNADFANNSEIIVTLTYFVS